MKYLILLILTFLLTNCDLDLLSSIPYGENENKSRNTLPEPPAFPSIEIEPNLHVDNNGYYHMVVNKSNQQTLHRISLQTSYYKTSTRIEWFADSYWIGNHMGFEFNVPIINGVSYTSTNDGSAQTMFAPVIELIGDTVTVQAVSDDFRDSIQIILE